MERVEIRCVPENRASAAIPRKLGYSLSQSDDDLIFALAAEDYHRQPERAQAPLAAYDAIGTPLIDDLG